MTKESGDQLRDFYDTYRKGTVADIGGQHDTPGIENFGLENGYDVCAAPLAQQYQTIVCTDTFEHIFDPVRAAEHIVQSLASGGYLFVTTVFSFEVHNHPVDTYRYTDQALKWLFRDLACIKCWFSDEPSDPGVPDADRFLKRVRVSFIGQKP